MVEILHQEQNNIKFDFAHGHFISHELIQKSKGKFFAGEIDRYQIIGALLNNPLAIPNDDHDDVGVGGSYDKQIEHRENIIQLLKNGYTFWTTDTDTAHVQERNNDFSNKRYFDLYFYFLTSNLLFQSSIFSYASMSNLDDYIFNRKKKKENSSFFNRRQVLKMIFTGLSLVATGHSFSLLNKKRTNYYSDFYKMAAFLQEKINSPEFKSVLEARIYFRNRVMACNINHMLQSHKNIINGITIFAGGAHKDLLSEYQKDYKNLESELAEDARTLLNKTVDILMHDENLSFEQLLNILFRYHETFPQPQQFGNKIHDFDLSLYDKDMPLSARAVLVQEIITILKSDNLDFRKKIILDSLLNHIILKNFQETIDNRNILRDFFLKYGINNSSLQAQELEIVDFPIKKQYIKSYYSERVNGDFFGVGILYGRVVSIIEIDFGKNYSKYIRIDDHRLVPLDEK